MPFILTFFLYLVLWHFIVCTSVQYSIIISLRAQSLPTLCSLTVSKSTNWFLLEGNEEHLSKADIWILWRQKGERGECLCHYYYYCMTFNLFVFFLFVFCLEVKPTYAQRLIVTLDSRIISGWESADQMGCCRSNLAKQAIYLLYYFSNPMAFSFRYKACYC